MEKFDSIMIGFGKGAKTLAVKLANNGEKVAVIEKSKKMYGGTCINVGCIPSKYMTVGAEKADCTQDKGRYYHDVMINKRKLIAALNEKNYRMLAQNPNIEVIDGEAVFEDSHTVRIDKKEKVYGEKIYIDTGSVAVLPDIAGLEGNPQVYTSENILDLERLPARLCIVGGGYIGLEFASYFASYGSKVTLFNDKSTFLPREDREIAECIYETMSQKIDFVYDAKVVSVTSATPNMSVLTLDTGNERKTYEAEAILIATGRTPATNGLGLSSAGVEVNDRGAIKVDERLKTTAPNIWAMGDVKGGLQFTYISLDDSRIIASGLEGGRRTTLNRGAIPYSVFIDPPFSHIGMTESEALAAGYEPAVAVMDAAAIPKAKVLRKADGKLKAVVDRFSGRILGASLFCAESHEMINLIKIAMDSGVTYDILRDTIYTHPTMSEAFNELFGKIKS